LVDNDAAGDRGVPDLAEELVTAQNLSVELAHPGYVARLKRSPDKIHLNDAHLLHRRVSDCAPNQRC
jgi:hypothetical protein